MTGVFRGLLVITGIALLLAIGNWPYGYYVMLRLLVPLSAALLAVMTIKSRQYGWLLLAVPAFFLWFPPIGVEMARESWLLLNLVAGIAFLAAANFFKLQDSKQ
jgi:MFS superfamily sulfate permease-like transporter